MTTRRVRFLVFTAILIPLLGASCRQGLPKEVAERLKPVELVWWGVNEQGDEMDAVLAEYRKVHPHVNVSYRKLRLEEYERELLSALAEGNFRGPDIFAIPSSWVRRYQSKLLPAPEKVTMPFKEIRGSVKKEVTGELRTTRVPTTGELASMFLDVVLDDAVLPDPDAGGQPKVYGLPLSVDTMVLYANRDLLNGAGIPEPAKTWTELQLHVPRLTKAAPDGVIVQAGAAIGTSRNVQRSFDLLSLLMMQNGAVMAAPNGQLAFDQIPATLSGARAAPPGEDALLYYTDFANPKKLVYTWNDTQPDSLEAFLQGRVAYFFGYSYHLPVIRARAPRINLSVTGIPHVAAAVDPTTGFVVGSDVIEGGQSIAINSANFWMNVASERTAYTNEAWDLLLFATTRPQVAEQFLAKAKRPTALRRLVPTQAEDPTLGVFARQLLTSRTWYRGKDLEAAERAFSELIDGAIRGGVPVSDLMRLTVQKIQQTL